MPEPRAHRCRRRAPGSSWPSRRSTCCGARRTSRFAFGVETIPPFLLAGIRHLTAGTLLFGWLRLRGTPWPTGRHWRSAAVVGGLMLLGGNGLVTWAEQKVPSGLAALIVASVPIWMTLLDGLRAPRAAARRRARWGSAWGSRASRSSSRRAGSRGGEHVDPWGAAALLTAALLWAVGSLYSKRAGLPSSTLLATAMEMIAGGAILLVDLRAHARVGGLLAGRGLGKVARSRSAT